MMKIYLTNQAANFDELLKELTTKPAMAFNKTNLSQKCHDVRWEYFVVKQKVKVDFYNRGGRHRAHF